MRWDIKPKEAKAIYKSVSHLTLEERVRIAVKEQCAAYVSESEQDRLPDMIIDMFMEGSLVLVADSINNKTVPTLDEIAATLKDEAPQQIGSRSENLLEIIESAIESGRTLDLSKLLEYGASAEAEEAAQPQPTFNELMARQEQDIDAQMYQGKIATNLDTADLTLEAFRVLLHIIVQQEEHTFSLLDSARRCLKPHFKKESDKVLIAIYKDCLRQLQSQGLIWIDGDGIGRRSAFKYIR
jgi:hypothetical protein